MTSGGKTEKDVFARILVIALAVFTAAKALLLALLSYNSRFVTDEFQQGGFSAIIPEGFYKNFFPMKTILFAYFYLPAHWLGENTVQVMLIARAQTLLLGFAFAVFVYAISRNIGRDRGEALFNVAVLLAFSNFMERAFSVRAEPLAVFFALSALWTLTREWRGAGRPFAAGLLSGLSFLATQKAVYFNAALGLGVAGKGVLNRDFKGAGKDIGLYIPGWALTLLAYGVYFRGIEFHEVIRHIFTAPARLALHGGEYFVQDLRQFIYQTLSRNTVAYALCFTGMLIGLARIRKISEPERVSLLSAISITVFIFNHNQPWPYVFIMALPFMSLFAADVFRLMAPSGGRRKHVAMMIALVALLPSFGRNVWYFSITNLLQNETALQAESLLKPGERYCDGVGMIVTRPIARPAWWDPRAIRIIRADAEKGDFDSIEKVFAKEPKLWILNYRVYKLRDVLEPYFRNSYIRIYPNVLISGVAASSDTETLFKNRWSGEYRLYDPRGEKLDLRLAVDGEIVDQPVRLDVGDHSIKLAGEGGPAYLLPAGIDVPFIIPPSDGPRLLY